MPHARRFPLWATLAPPATACQRPAAIGACLLRSACLLLGVCLLLSAAAHLRAQEPPDLILHHGKIFTANADDSLAEAIAVRQGRITAIGANDDVLKLAGASTQAVDLAGKFVIPGLIDSHTHPVGAAMHEFDHPVPEMETVADVLAYVKWRAERAEEGEWIWINQIFITRLKEQRFPTRAELDDAAPRHAVVFSTGPDAAVNSQALVLSGITAATEVRGAGYLEKDPATGELTGILRNCKHLLKSQTPPSRATAEDRRTRLKALFADYNAVGITAIADRNGSESGVQQFAELRAASELTVRVAVSYGVNAGGKLESVQEAIREVARHPLRQPDPMLRIVGVKSFLDGGMLTGSAYMREPWGVSSIYSITDPAYRGLLFIPPEQLEAVVQTAVEADLQFTAHSVGDGAVHALLDAYSAVDAKREIRSTRPCITHCNFMSAAAIDEMQRLGVTADIQPAWLYLDARTLHAQFGDARLRYFQPLRTLFDKGVVAGGGSDHMQKIGSLRSINPYNPFLGMWVALSRRAKWFEGSLHPEEALSRTQALRFYTINNAYLLFWEHETGSLEVGKQADLAVLDRDLLTCDLDDVRATRVLRTYLGGKLVYEAR